MTTPKAKDGAEYVDVHKKWPHEALDFTPWLADNLDLLSRAIEVKLERVQMEAMVGPFFCDIQAREVDSGVTVAIENQLGPTDHNHLGQLLTYAAGLNAGIAVWVASAFFYEHAAALHRLNTWTRDGLQVYGVKVMVLNTGDALEPRLCPVVTPDRWDKDITLPRGAADPRKQLFHDFFQPLVNELIRDGFADKATQNFGRTDRLFHPLLDPGVGYAAALENTGAWVTLHIQTKDKALTEQIFDELKQDQENIEARIAADPAPEWHWYRHDAFTFSSISIRRDGSIDDPPEKLKETRAWMLRLLPRLKEVFDPRVNTILQELRRGSPGPLCT